MKKILSYGFGSLIVALFALLAVTSTTQAQISPLSTIILNSPDGSQNYTLGRDSIYISWTPATPGVSTIQLVSSANINNAIQLYGQKGNGDPTNTNGFFTYSLPSNLLIAPGQYYISVTPVDGTRVVRSKPFQIVSPVSVVTPVNGVYSIAGIVGNQQTYSPGSPITFQVKAIQPDGSPASQLQSFNIQAGILDPTNLTKGYLQNVNGSYDSYTGYWTVRLTAPNTVDTTYTVNVSLYCGYLGLDSICAQKYGANGQQDKTFQFRVSGTPITGGGSSSSGGGGSVGQPICYPFYMNLSNGSTGADVVALQTWLIANGYDIHSLSSKNSAKGYFGTQTQQALRLYQRAVGLPTTGVFDPLTRQMINNSCKSGSGSTGINNQILGTSFVDLLVKPAYSNGNQTVGIWAAIKGDMRNKNISKWTLDISCTPGITMQIPSLKELCNTQQVYYAYNYYDVTEDIVLLTVDASTNGTYNSNPNVNFVLTAYGNDGTTVSDKETVPLGFTNTNQTVVITSSNQTSSLNPTISGIARGVNEVGVVLGDNGGKVYGSGSIPVVNGNWSVTVYPSLTPGQYTVKVYDSNNNLLTTGNLSVTGYLSTNYPTNDGGIYSSNLSAGMQIAGDASLSFQNIQNTTGEDRVGAWDVFQADGTPDIVSQLNLKLGATKTIKSILLTTESDGNAAFTSKQNVNGKQMYPITVLYNGRQLNTAYDQTLGTYSPGYYTFKVYIQGGGVFNTFTYTVYFTDGTYVTSTGPGNMNLSSNQYQYNPVTTPVINYPTQIYPTTTQCPVGYTCNSNTISIPVNNQSIVTPVLNPTNVTTVVPGQTIVLTGSGFTTSQKTVVNFSGLGSVQDVVPNIINSYSMTVTVPSNLPNGQYTVSVVSYLSSQKTSSKSIILNVKVNDKSIPSQPVSAQNMTSSIWDAVNQYYKSLQN